MILTVEYVPGILLMIHCHFQGQRVNSKVKFAKTYFDDSRSFSRSKDRFESEID